MTSRNSKRQPRSEYEQLLLEKRRSIMTALGNKFDALARMGRVAEEDQAKVIHDEFISLQLNSLDYAHLRLVDEALDRMGSGDYGICLSCEELIPAKRLRALPWARYCVGCQERVDAEHRPLDGVPAGPLFPASRAS